jgi:hypothetical protein
VRDQQADNRGARQIGPDYLRGFVIVMVVLHHAVLAYCRFGHFDPRHYLWSTAPVVDPQRWVGFDIAVLFNDYEVGTTRLVAIAEWLRVPPVIATGAKPSNS